MKETMNDTILGISTALGKGAISIVRMSGSAAIQIASKVFKGKKDLRRVPSHTIHYGHIVDPQSNEVIDEVLVMVYRAPKTYTKEDIVEINCHGGIFVTNQIFELLALQGARIAEPGEFTKRAFLNGRIDLTKAEAVMDVIDAESKAALRLANYGLRGDIKATIDDLRVKLLNIIATIAVNIDYPEYDDVEELTNSVIKPQIKDIYNQLKTILSYSSDAKKLKEGIKTVIIGRPNVGKSSLLNALLREDKAIVTPIPGTTRDIVEGKLILGSIMLNLIDTAGIREAVDEVEKIGISKSQSKIDEAELILLILDGSAPLEKMDYDLLELVKNRQHLKVINKSDLPLVVDPEKFSDSIVISATNQQDIKKLEEAIKIYVMIRDVNETNVSYISNTRQLAKINEAINNLDEALKAIAEDVYIDIVDIYIQAAWNSLGEIIGELRTDRLLNELFSKFCLGK
ncbi:MAG TPA: tRNA uridine-5-carboxymethylaminomethyl(34) synthesis GTPase MnmE [Acholeplasmataceae bacterium]|jgi:tRNA modification GTPase|nr:tRNA uridine-5-carboxymethylaminomethyl(34) synthesis GTPase MnmE [Acholeplasmataceae bacterium]